jgi:hypothetical protein
MVPGTDDFLVGYIKNGGQRLMNRLFSRSVFIVLSILLSFCSKRSDSDVASLLALLFQNAGDPNAISILDMEVRDFSSFDGRCMDRFIGITAGSYYEVHYPNEIRNLPTKKAKTSTKPCTQMGFSGGVINRVDDGISFRSYVCGSSTSTCSKSAIVDAGFEMD